MTQKVLSFSVPKSDTANLKLVTDVKAECRRTGQSFSWVVLRALEQYVNGKEASSQGSGLVKTFRQLQ